MTDEQTENKPSEEPKVEEQSNESTEDKPVEEKVESQEAPKEEKTE